MSKASVLTKRTLNVLLIFLTLWIVLFTCVTGIQGLLFIEWLGVGVAPALVGYGLLASVSYVLFGRATLWHREPA